MEPISLRNCWNFQHFYCFSQQNPFTSHKIQPLMSKYQGQVLIVDYNHELLSALKMWLSQHFVEVQIKKGPFRRIGRGGERNLNNIIDL